MERQRSCQRGDGLFPTVKGGEMGKVAESALACFQAL